MPEVVPEEVLGVRVPEPLEVDGVGRPEGRADGFTGAEGRAGGAGRCAFGTGGRLLGMPEGERIGGLGCGIGAGRAGGIGERCMGGIGAGRMGGIGLGCAGGGMGCCCIGWPMGVGGGPAGPRGPGLPTLR